jgi:glycosyltransferase involved in cell wall biosynthesis
MYPLPIGMAATNRILAYSKGLIENNVNVDVYIPIPTERPTKKSKYGNIGTVNGINYYYTIGRFSNRFKVIRAISILSGYRKLIGFIATCRSININNKKYEYSCIILSTDQIASLFVYSILGKYLKVPFIFIFDEYPVPIIRHRQKNNIPYWMEFLYKVVLRNVSAYISISEELKRYFNSLCKNNTLILPVITDVSRFNKKRIKTNQIDNAEYICYMGNMDLAKDNIDVIIKAFSLISNRYPDIELHLYGAPRKITEKHLIKLIQSFKLNKKVKLMGKVSSELVPQILMNAKILVSSQPNTLRARGGFPTKLGEYLAAGVPSLLTDVGENAKYVKNNEHVFFTEPNNPEMYAEKLTYILDNYQAAKEVALSGKEYLMQNYSHIAMGRKLKEFIVNVPFGDG